MEIVRIGHYLPESASAGRLEALSGGLGHPTPERLADVLARVRTRRIEIQRSAARLSKRNFTVIVEFVAGEKK